MSRDADPGSEAELMRMVDVDPDVHHATEADEEAVLRVLYGEPGKDGVYRGDGA